jgi:Fur family ferric uptake transcriptional regulator
MHRTTKTRQALVSIFQEHPEPLSLSELLFHIRQTHPKTAHSTVFRLVLKLEEEGKVVRIDWRERGSRYEWADLPHHHHIVCLECGTVTDLGCEFFNFKESDIERKTGFSVRRHSIEFEGVCRECQRNATAMK